MNYLLMFTVCLMVGYTLWRLRREEQRRRRAEDEMAAAIAQLTNSVNRVIGDLVRRERGIEERLARLEELGRPEDQAALSLAPVQPPVLAEVGWETESDQAKTDPEPTPRKSGGAGRARQSRGRAKKGESSLRYREVHQLADQGYDASEIARRTGLARGEIQLILDLRPAQQA